jgi:hypothetical protein
VTGTYRCNEDGIGFEACTGCQGAAMPTLDDIAKTCAIDSSCLGSPIGQGVAACAAVLEGAIVEGLPQMRRAVDCVHGATDCKSALDCIDAGHGPDYCQAHPGWSCDGPLAIQCPSTPDWPGLAITNCALLGMRCTAANFGASCTDGVACDPTAPSTCDGNFAITCDGNTKLRRVTECGAIGAGFVCSAPDGCVPPGPVCSATWADHCDGNTAVICANGHQVSTDCTLSEANCVDGLCIDAAQLCRSDAQTADLCNGDSYEICTNGHWTGVPCASIGFAKCGMKSTIAACVN